MRLLSVFEQGERVIAALSGGADSTCLVRLLAAMRDRGDIELCAAHLNHMIRGEAAMRDQAFVEALCRELSVPLLTERADVPALARESGRGLETEARFVRRAFLLRSMERARCSVIATAHHADDQLETVLMHLLRGGGLRGAGGIRAREGVFARPLLETGKQEILDCLREMGQPYCQDQTNMEENTPRNALRLRAVPEITRIYPGAREALGRFARIAQEEDDCLDRQARDYLENYARRTPFGMALRITGAHPAVLRRALREWAKLEDFASAQRLLEMCYAPRGALEIGRVRFERTGAHLYAVDMGVRPPAREEPVRDGARLEGLGCLSVRPAPPTPVRFDRFAQVVDGRALEGAVLRTRRAGDVMRPLGAPGEKKLSDVLTDKHVDRPLRDYTPLIARGNRILWAVGVCLSQEAAITKDTARCERLEWKREEDTPWTKRE